MKIKVFSKEDNIPESFVGKCVPIRYYNYQTISTYANSKSATGYSCSVAIKAEFSNGELRI